MRTIVPGYYPAFACTASACGHNCCREGWEIGIDDAHADRYKRIAADPKEPLSEAVSKGVFLPTVRQRREGERPHIQLLENGVCPFLNEDGLCKLILQFGDNALCQICADHPRFRNYYADHMEMGVGLCCEEAVRLVLETPLPLVYVDAQTGLQAEPEHRKETNRKSENSEETKELDFCFWGEYLLSLDCLEKTWPEMLRKLKSGVRQEKEYPEEQVWKRIEEYLCFRHEKKDGPRFVTFSMQLIRGLYDADTLADITDPERRLSEILRIYSSEIEYSEEAMEAVKKKLD